MKLIDSGSQHDQWRGRVDGIGEAIAGADRVDQAERLAVHVDDDYVRLADREARQHLLARVRGPDRVPVGGQVVGLLCPGRLCARSGRPVMSGPAPSR